MSLPWKQAKPKACQNSVLALWGEIEVFGVYKTPQSTGEVRTVDVTAESRFQK